MTTRTQKADTEKMPPAAVRLWRVGAHECGCNGVAIKTAHSFLLFDYCYHPRGELPADSDRGILGGGNKIAPGEIADLDVTVFVTHAHADHYDPAVKGFAGRISRLRFVIPQSMEAEFCESGVVERTTVMRRADAWTDVGEMKVWPFLCEEGARGCCYLVDVGGIVIAYSNSCYDGGSFRSDTEGRVFLERLQRLLGGRCIDIACLGYGPSYAFPEKTAPRLIVPVHFAIGENPPLKSTLGRESTLVPLGDGQEQKYLSVNEDSQVKGTGTRGKDLLQKEDVRTQGKQRGDGDE